MQDTPSLDCRGFSGPIRFSDEFVSLLEDQFHAVMGFPASDIQGFMQSQENKGGEEDAVPRAS